MFMDCYENFTGFSSFPILARMLFCFFVVVKPISILLMFLFDVEEAQFFFRSCLVKGSFYFGGTRTRETSLEPE